MNAFIDDQPIAPETITVRVLKFGKPVAGWRTVGCRVAFSHAELVQAFDAFYRQYAAEDVEEQDPAVGDAARQLRALHWPPLSEVASKHPRLLEGFLVQEELVYHALSTLFSQVPMSELPPYLINEIDAVSVADGEIRFAGAAVVRPAE